MIWSILERQLLRVNGIIVLTKLMLFMVVCLLACKTLASGVELRSGELLYLETNLASMSTAIEVDSYDKLRSLPNPMWRYDNSERRAGFSQDAHWYRLSLSSPVLSSSSPQPNWQALIDHALLRRLDAFLVQDEKVVDSWQWQVKSSDQDYSFSGRPTFDFMLDPGERYELYIRVESNFSLFMPLSIGSPSAVAQFLLHKLTFLNIFYGVMAGLLIYSLVIAINVRSTATLYYSCYLAFILGYNLQINGFIRGWSSPIADSFDRILVYLCSLGVFVAALFFCRAFLKIRHRHGFFYWLHQLLIVLMVLTALAALVGQNSLFILGMQLISPLFFVYALSAGAISIRRGNRYAILFQVGWLAMAMGTTIHQLLLSGYLPTNFFTQEAMRLGAMIEAFMLSWALALRFKSIEEGTKMLEDRYRFQLETANFQLTEALRIENKNNQLKDDFIRVVGHELRTPVNTLVQSFDLLTSPHQEYLADQFQRDSSVALSRLYHHVENLVVASELDSGRSFCSPNWFELSEFIQTLRLPFQDTLTQDGSNRLWVEQPDVAMEIFADAAKLERILHNLVDNALKFCPDGHVRLIFDIRPAQVIVKVLDAGVGMSEGQKRRAHQFMAQHDQSMLRKNEGMGIGLNICFGLTRLMAGQIHIESQMGKGTEVLVNLPIQSRQRMDHVRASHLAEQQEGLKILVVEDNILNAKLLLSIIRTLNVEVSLASNGQQAVDMVRNDHFDLILMDIQMPVMDGFTAAKQIRSLGTLENAVPIIAVSANNASCDQREASQSGMNDFIAKPISPVSLKKKICRYLPQLTRPEQ